MLGDAKCDERLTIADAAAIIQHTGNQDEYDMSEQRIANADCCNPGDGVTGKDANVIQILETELITSLPVFD